MRSNMVCFLFVITALLTIPLKILAIEEQTGTNNLWYYQETFSDKYLDKNQLKDNERKISWEINSIGDDTNIITNEGTLKLGNYRYMQRAVLADKHWGNKQNYAMEFTINIQKLGNEGNSHRPIAIIIPRSKDKEFDEFYAVTYFMENTISNQFIFKWALINTAAPSKMEPLVENYYLLKENVDYTACVQIENTALGNVNIKFFIDGPSNPLKEYKPLLDYTDKSIYKIHSGVTGPALGTVGFSDSGWGTSPIVHYDNIKLFDLEHFRQYQQQLKKYADNNPFDIQGHKNYMHIKYLFNLGVLDEYPDQTFKPDEYVSILEFLKMILRINPEKSRQFTDEAAIKRAQELEIIDEKEFMDYNRPLTRYDAALIVTRYLNKLTNKGDSSILGDLFSIFGGIFGNNTAKSYTSSIKDYRSIPEKYRNAVINVFYEGYLRLDDKFQFMGNTVLTRSDAADLMLRILDDGYRKVNYFLELPSILSSGAVFQANKPIPVWGRGVTGDTITVEFKNQRKKAVVKNGYWYLELDPVSYGGPYNLTINSSKKKIILEDIVIGEVFIVAGQSNAEMYLIDCNGADEVKKKFLNSSKLRFFSGEKITAVKPNFNSEGNWDYAYNFALDYSPAVGTFFAEKLLELNPDLANVTLGIIEMTYGGTTIEAFMPNCITDENRYIPTDSKPIMSGFWNGFMEPIAPFASRAIIYYQGENSAHLGYKYEPLLRDYLRGLRTEFNDPDLKVMLVQLAGFGYNNYRFNLDEWPVIRGIQLKVSNSNDNTGIVTAVDLSDPDPLEIHPKEKREIGSRLAYLGMDLIYGKANRKSSAQVIGYYFRDNKVIISFKDRFGKLYFKNNIPRDIQVLDHNWEWHMAKSKINTVNNTLIVWNDEIKTPMGVRYAWVNNPNISLYNGVDLPVFPFRLFNDLDKSGEKALRIRNHSLEPGDAIVNMTRSNVFRNVSIFNNDIITHEYAIAKQTAGDTIELFTRITELLSEEGSTGTIIKIEDHGLAVGDWIRNNTRKWTTRQVKAVLDKNTIQVEEIPEQTVGDSIGMYRLIRTVIAE